MHKKQKQINRIGLSSEAACAHQQYHMGFDKLPFFRYDPCRLILLASFFVHAVVRGTVPREAG